MSGFVTELDWDNFISEHFNDFDEDDWWYVFRRYPDPKVKRIRERCGGEFEKYMKDKFMKRYKKLIKDIPPPLPSEEPRSRRGSSVGFLQHLLFPMSGATTPAGSLTTTPLPTPPGSTQTSPLRQTETRPIPIPQSKPDMKRRLFES
jgi:hypothetical protein